MTRKISEERKAGYYLGMVVMVVGGLLFGSVFFSVAMSFGDRHLGSGFGKSFALRAFGGMGLMILGGIIRTVSARGAAGSGLKLDPEQAREDLEPFSRQAGGMLKDAMDEADIDLSGRGRSPERVVMIRCQACGKLNEEDSKFCQECGKPI